MTDLYENGTYCIYLRKSRADKEAEQRGEGETLARHEKILLDLAKRLHITIQALYKEVVSGETISDRPVMQQLLAEVEQGKWDGVLVVEVERLARGDTIDQGTVSRAFQFSDTRIITPSKTYDPQNEFDEEYFEFGLFMSRREYKTIKRRLNAGRISSIKEGKYVGNVPPYGYRRVKLPHDKGYTLEPIPEQVSVVKMIFDLYVNGLNGEQMGISKIVKRLNLLGIPTAKNNIWTTPSIKDILSNPVYIGMIRWNWRKTVKKVENGNIIKQRPRSTDFILCQGLHPAIIPKDVYDTAQLIRSKNPPRPVNSISVVRNPLAGLIYCSKCGRSMSRRPYHKTGYPDSLLCQNTSCPTVSSHLSIVEQAVINGLQEILENYKLNITMNDPCRINTLHEKELLLKQKKHEAEKLVTQKNRLYDLLEQGIYTTDIFLERSEELRNKANDYSNIITHLEEELDRERTILNRKENFVPECEYLLKHYWEWDAATKNSVLKKLIEKIIYSKDTKNLFRHGTDVNFKLEIYPRII